ncbi:MAG: preprotein translocase subunit SecE [Eubacteriales bacterium]|nr:preprotein translocase subunit SecE [Eubacteriales bacterium]
MGEVSKKNNAGKTSWTDGLKAEFRKIIWPDKKDLTKQTTAVIVVSVILGVIISIVDTIMQYGIDFLIK